MTRPDPAAPLLFAGAVAASAATCAATYAAGFAVAVWFFDAAWRLILIAGQMTGGGAW